MAHSTERHRIVGGTAFINRVPGLANLHFEDCLCVIDSELDLSQLIKDLGEEQAINKIVVDAVPDIRSVAFNGCVFSTLSNYAMNHAQQVIENAMNGTGASVSDTVDDSTGTEGPRPWLRVWRALKVVSWLSGQVALAWVLFNYWRSL